MHADLLNVEEYNALQTLSIARNYDGIAHAQAEKPKRQIDRGVKLPEQPLYVEGADGNSWVVKANLKTSVITRLRLSTRIFTEHTASRTQTWQIFSLTIQLRESKLSRRS